jgi:hypothetical protein
MTPAWAQRREEMLSDGLVSPDVFTQMVDRLGEFVVPYRQALETAADPHPMHLFLQRLLSHVARKNAEAIAAFVDVERQIIRSCTWPLRIHTPGPPVDSHRGKKTWTRGLSWHPSRLLTPGDALEVSRVDAPRQLRPPPLAASHHHGWLTPPLVGATAARGTGAPPGGSRHGRSALLPWRACRAAPAWPSRSRW